MDKIPKLGFGLYLPINIIISCYTKKKKRKHIFLKQKELNNMKKIYVIHTGGTIGMEKTQDETIELQNEHPLFKQNHLNAHIIHHQLFHLPSPHMTPKKMLKLRNHIAEKATDFDGFVITHGTDTLEETAYFLKLTLPIKKPVILTGAMRPINEVGSDALYNFNSALLVALSDRPNLSDIFVVMDGEIHDPYYVTKVHTTRIGAFQSPNSGPIALLTKQGISLLHQPLLERKYFISNVDQEVILLKAYTGMCPNVLTSLLDLKINGLVLEAFGQGNIPSTIAIELEKFLQRNIPILLVSRCPQGIVEANYNYIGGGKYLQKQGVLFSNGLNGPKARLKLSILLSNHIPYQQLQSHFISS